jgi:hypothetical protein
MVVRNGGVVLSNKFKSIPFIIFLAFLLTLTTRICLAGEDLVTTAQNKKGKVIPYILNYQNLSPRYAIILFPGDSGDVDPRMGEGKLVYKFRGNFLLRSRNFIVDEEFVTVTTNSSDDAERIQAIIDDLKRRFLNVQIYLMGTSKGTYDTIALAGYLSDKIAGEIHTSSVPNIAYLDAKKYTNRHLVVHHLYDACRATPLYPAEASHKKYGTDLIVMTGGNSVGNDCEPFSHHGYNGIERETIDAIKKWIKQGERKDAPIKRPLSRENK